MDRETEKKEDKKEEESGKLLLGLLKILMETKGAVSTVIDIVGTALYTLM